MVIVSVILESVGLWYGAANLGMAVDYTRTDGHVIETWRQKNCDLRDVIDLTLGESPFFFSAQGNVTD